jgi:hypothetical protein
LLEHPRLGYLAGLLEVGSPRTGDFDEGLMLFSAWQKSIGACGKNLQLVRKQVKKPRNLDLFYNNPVCW